MPNFEIAICPVTPYAQNCSLVWDKTSKRGAVIDPGGDVARLLDVIGELGLVIEKIVLTHGHIDHAGGAAELREALQAKSSASGGTGIVPIEGPHIADKFLLDDLAKQGARVGIQGARPVTPDLWLEEGGTLDIAGQTYSILHCPGHTPGSLVFVNAEARLSDTVVDVTDEAIDVCPVGAILKKRVGFKVPIGRRTYDLEPIGSDLEARRRPRAAAPTGGAS